MQTELWDDNLLELIRDAATRVAGTETELVLDLCVSDEGFEHAWRNMQAAYQKALTGAPWIADCRMSVFTDICYQGRMIDADGRSRWDAILCLCSTDPAEAPQTGTRMVALALGRHDKIALLWKSGAALPFEAVAPVRVEIRFDSDNNRWKLRYGDQPERELDPAGSELIGEKLVETKGQTWFQVFSGDLL
ncbi:MAG: hypothetical protein GXY44_01295 [Phycisphaerales bacterium]|nr:hypothetical protein [Phycisphaerales bacterium]